MRTSLGSPFSPQRCRTRGVEKNTDFTAASGHKGYGATLQFTRDSIAYQVAISDPQGVYGGATISSLSGTTDGNLDVVLDKLPPATGTSAAAGAATAMQARQAVLGDLGWTLRERRAILSVMDGLGSLRGATSPALVRFMHNFEVILRDRGINAGLF